MFDWQAFHFLRPAWLLAILPLALIFILYFRQSNLTSVWSKVCDAHLLQHLLISTHKRRSRTPLWLLAIAWLLATLALAGPTWSKLEQPLYLSEDALILVFDLSRSMDASDIQPSRLSLAKFKIIDLLKKQHEGKTALIVYAADPYIVSPLTRDADTIIAQVPALVTALMPRQGSRADLALSKAYDLMRQTGIPRGHILLITDGIDTTSDSINVAQDLKQQGIKTSVFAVGTQQGAPIPLSEGGFLKDAKGSIVVSQLDNVRLEELANAGGGLYQVMSTDKHDIERLSHYFANSANFDRKEEQKQTTDMWEEQGPWLTLLLLPLAALAFRRGWLAVLFVAVMLPPQPSYAFDWQNLWLTPDQQAARSLQQQDIETAAKLFEDPQWQGTALYQKGDYEQAAQAFAKVNSPEAHYNRANALAKAGKLDEAINVYDKVLKQQPEHNDAQFNRDLVQKLLDQQQQQDSQENSNHSQDQQEDEQSQQQNGNQGESEQNQSQQKESQQAENQPGESGKDQTENQQNDQQQTQQASPQNQAESTEEQAQQQSQQEQAEQGDEAQQHNLQQDKLSDVDQETQQAIEQWLRRIPDDPGGLLRRKFIREHQKQRANPSANVNEQPW